MNLNFRFEIKENDSIYFYVTDREIINKTYKGKISTLAAYKSARLVIEMENPNHHILTTNPTIYRDAWDFFMVFKSPKFNNMYFRKNDTAEIERFTFEFSNENESYHFCEAMKHIFQQFYLFYQPE